jgi:hypothetical protein
MEILIAIPFFALIIWVAKSIDKGTYPFYDRTEYLCPSCGCDIMDPECGFTESDCTNIPKEAQDATG